MTRPNRAPSDRHKAVTLICKSIPNLDDAAIKKMLCVSMGHPPIIKRMPLVGGGTKLVCARCKETAPPNAGVWSMPAEGVWVNGAPTPTDKLMTDMTWETQAVSV
jgi:hypothetical protein